MGIPPVLAAVAALGQVVPPDAPPPQAQLPPGYRTANTEAFPDDPRIEIVRRLLGSSKFEEALIVARAVQEQHSDVDRAAFYVGLCLTKLKQYEQARPHLVRARASTQPFPERKHASHFLAWGSYHLGELDRAHEEFLEHLEAVPNEPDSLFGLGLIAFDRDDLDAAEARFRESIAVQQGPEANRRELSKVWIRLGDVFMRRGDAAEAEKAFMEGLGLYANHYEGWAKLARARDRLGKTKEADSARNEERRALERVRGAERRPIPTPPPADAAPPQPAAPARPEQP
jgi:tetratricopeptide (TPR) repeat protein